MNTRVKTGEELLEYLGGEQGLLFRRFHVRVADGVEIAVPRAVFTKFLTEHAETRFILIEYHEPRVGWGLSVCVTV